MAWVIEQRELCPHCGTFAWQWGSDEHPETPFEADGYLCRGCEAIAVEQDRRKEEPAPPGVRLVLYPKEV